MAKNAINNNHTQNQTIGIIFVACAAISFSLLPLFFNFLSQNKIGIGVQVLTRLSIGAFTLFAWNIIFTRRQRPRSSLNRSLITLFILNGFILMSAFLTYSLAIGLGTSPVKAVLLIYLSPIYTALLSWVFLQERFNYRKIFLIITGVFGIFIAIGFWKVGDLYSFKNSDLLAILNGLLSALIIIIGRKSGSLGDISSLEALQISLFCALIWALVLAALTHLVGYNRFNLWDLSLSPQSILLLLSIGIFGTTFPYIFLYTGLQHLEASISGLVLLLEPVSVFILQALILGVPIFWWQILGGSILVIAGYMIQSESKEVTN
jgi:drug/metabolite transporter (DMT)-like permease